MSGSVAPASRFLLASGIASDMSRTATPEMARLSLSPFIPAEENGESVMVVRDIAMGGTFTTIAPQLMQVVRLLKWGIITVKAVLLLLPDHIGRIVKRGLQSGTCGGSKLEG